MSPCTCTTLLFIALASAACARSEGAPPADASAPSRASAPPPVTTTPAPAAKTPEEAVAALRTAEVFEDTNVFASGELSRGVAAFRVVLATPDAKTTFHALVDDATLAGKLYGAAGLYFVDPPAFDAALAKIAAAGGIVAWQRGCFGTEHPVAEVIRTREPKRIEVPEGMRLTAWFAAHPDGGHCDLSGGCLPLTFVDDDRPAPRGPAR